MGLKDGMEQSMIRHAVKQEFAAIPHRSVIDLDKSWSIVCYHKFGMAGAKAHTEAPYLPEHLLKVRPFRLVRHPRRFKFDKMGRLGKPHFKSSERNQAVSVPNGFQSVNRA